MTLDSMFTNLKMKRKKDMGLYGAYITAAPTLAVSKITSAWSSQTKCLYHRTKMIGLQACNQCEAWGTAMPYTPASNLTVQDSNLYNSIFHAQIATQTASAQAFFQAIDYGTGDSTTVQFTTWNQANPNYVPETDEQRIAREEREAERQ